MVFLGVNVVPIFESFGYVNCAGGKNNLASYMIEEEGQFETEVIFKSKRKNFIFKKKFIKKLKNLY